MIHCSFVIHVYDEYDEFVRLSLLLQQFMQPGDELIVTSDPNDVTPSIDTFIRQNLKNTKHYQCEFDAGKPSQDIFTNTKCNNEVVFGACPDEIPSPLVLLTFRKYFEQGHDGLSTPRVNLYTNFTPETLKNMYKGDRPDTCYTEGWTEFGHCWPDYQTRIFSNAPHVTFAKDPHQGLLGFRHLTRYPAEIKYAMLHIKSLHRQGRKNKLDDIANGKIIQ